MVAFFCPTFSWTVNILDIISGKDFFMKVTINNQILDVAEKIRVLDLIEGDKYQYQAARVNNRIR